MNVKILKWKYNIKVHYRSEPPPPIDSAPSQTYGQDAMSKNRSIVDEKRQYRRFIHEYPNCYR